MDNQQEQFEVIKQKAKMGLITIVGEETFNILDYESNDARHEAIRKYDEASSSKGYSVIPLTHDPNVPIIRVVAIEYLEKKQSSNFRK